MFKLSLQLQKAAQHLRGTTLNVTAVLATLVLLVVPRALAATTATNSCQLKSPKGAIQHVIYVQFDNTHFRRDNPDHRHRHLDLAHRCLPGPYGAAGIEQLPLL